MTRSLNGAEGSATFRAAGKGSPEIFLTILNLRTIHVRPAARKRRGAGWISFLCPHRLLPTGKTLGF
jgi:hypothetical protein